VDEVLGGKKPSVVPRTPNSSMIWTKNVEQVGKI